MRNFAKFIPAIAAFLVGAGLQVSGVHIPVLGYALMALACGLLLIPAWNHLKRLRFRMPIVYGEQPGSMKPLVEPQSGNDTGWWTALANEDRKDIKHRVPLRDTYAGIESVKTTGYCCIRFVFVFINATVYTVSVGQNISGAVYAGGDTGGKLPDKLVLDMESRELVFPHGVGFGLRCSLQIRQPYLNELTGLSGRTVQLGLDSTKIMADLIDPAGKRLSQFPLEIPSRVVIKVPDLTQDRTSTLVKVDLSTE